MDPELRRLATAIEAIWKLEVDALPLRRVHFGDPGPGLLASVEWDKALGGDCVTITRSTTDKMLKWALHEIGHRHFGPGASEAMCDRYAEIYLPTWAGPVEHYVKTGDPGQINSLLTTMASVQRDARKAQKRKADEDARKFAEVCKQHAVIGLEQAPNRHSAFVKFASVPAKALDPEIEAEIDRVCPQARKSPAWLAFVRHVLTRRKRYTRFVADLAAAGLIPA